MGVQFDRDGWPTDLAAEVAADAECVAKASPFPSPAGKARLAQRLVKMFPAHQTYVEPFAGAASVFFAKSAAPVEVLNDVDGDIVGAYRAMQALTPGDVQALKAMDWTGSRDTFHKVFASQPTDAIERLYKFLYTARYSYGSFRKGSFDPGREGQTARTPALIERALPRLKAARVLHGDYADAMKLYDGPKTLHFLDPPYAGFEAAVKEGSFDEGRFADTLAGLDGKWLLTYGFRGDLVKALRKRADVTLKTIRPMRTIRSPYETGPRKRLSTLIASNYDPATVAKALDAIFGDDWIVKTFEPDVDAAWEDEAQKADASAHSEHVPDISATPASGEAAPATKAAKIIEFPIHRVTKAGTDRAAGDAAAQDAPHEVFGIVLEPDDPAGDSQDDTYTEAEVEAACRRFNEKLALDGQADHAGRQHRERLTTQGVRIIESYIAPADMVVEGVSIRRGTWLMRWEILDADLWADIEAGRVTGFSIGGTAIRTPLDAVGAMAEAA